MDAYNVYIAKVDLAKDFLSQFDADNIQAQITNLNQQLAKRGI